MMSYVALTLRSGHILYLKPGAILGFYPDVSEGTWLITPSPTNIVVEESPEAIMKLLQSKPPVPAEEEDLLR